MTYRTEEGELAHRVFQIPCSEADLKRRVELMHDMSIVGGVTGVFMALMSVKDAVAEVNPQYGANIERLYRYVRDNDLRAAEVITDPKGDRSRRAHEQDDPDLYLRIVRRTDEGHRGARRQAAHHRRLAGARAGGDADQGHAPGRDGLRRLVLHPGQCAGREHHQPQLRARPS